MFSLNLILAMDIDLLSKMVKELILDRDEVTLPGVGTFVAETVPASFSDKGYTINPPYRKLSFRQRQNTEDNSLIELYLKSNSGVDLEQAKKIVTEFLLEMKEVLKQKKNIVFPGLGRLRSTKENNFFFVADEDLDIYPGGFGLEPISLKTHQETPEEVSDVIQKLKEEILPEEPELLVEPVEEVVEPVEEVVEPVEEPVVEVVEEPAEEVIAEPVEEPIQVAEVPSEGHRPECICPSEGTPASEESKTLSKAASKTSGWLKAIIWILGTILGLLILYILASHMFPDFFDSLLYSKEELEILNF